MIGQKTLTALGLLVGAMIGAPSEAAAWTQYLYPNSNSSSLTMASQTCNLKPGPGCSGNQNGQFVLPFLNIYGTVGGNTWENTVRNISGVSFNAVTVQTGDTVEAKLCYETTSVGYTCGNPTTLGSGATGITCCGVGSSGYEWTNLGIDALWAFIEVDITGTTASPSTVSEVYVTGS